MPNWRIWSRINLSAPNNAIPLTDFGFARVGDRGAHTWVCEVTMDGAPAALDSYTARGFFIRPDNYSVEVAGEVSGAQALCTLPAACYEAPGRLIGCLKIVNETSGESVTVAAGFMDVEPSATDSYVDPDRVIPSLSELLAQIDACREATDAAVEAAEEARSIGAVRFDEEQSLTDEQKARARTNIGIADTATDSAPAIVVEPLTASVDDAADGFGLQLKIEFLPKQSGSGTPSESNIRPIDRWTSVEFTHVTDGLSVPYTVTLPFIMTGGVVLIHKDGAVEIENWWNVGTYDGAMTITGEWVSDRDVYAPGTLPTIGASIAWKRRTPVHLTGESLSLKTAYGFNKFEADHCNCSVLQYTADTKTYVDDHTEGALRYDDTQELTDEQQSQARQNIGVDSILMNCNSVKLCDSTQPTNNTDCGITFTWTGNSKCVVTGTPNGNAISRSCVKANPLPTDEVKAGGTYFVYFKSTGTKCRVQASWYIDNPGGFPRAGSQLLTKSQMFTVPAAAISFFLEAYVPSGSGAVNETVNIGLYNAPTNVALWEAIQAL